MLVTETQCDGTEILRETRRKHQRWEYGEKRDLGEAGWNWAATESMGT